MHKVLIEPANYETVRAAVDKAFEVFPTEISGKTVLVKPNVLRASEAWEGICTHPAVLRAVVDKVRTFKPASVVVGDNPGILSYGANEASFRQTGLMEASGDCYRNIGEDSIQIDFESDFADRITISRIVLDADVIISVPKFKTHGLTVMTGAIKNSYGYLPGAQKAKLHRLAGAPERFHEVIVDVFRLRIPDLFIMDAVVGMEGNGPASPDLRDIGLLLASDNAVAMDAVIATMMGCEPGRLRFLQKAKALALGDYNLNRVQIIGALEKIPDFKLPPLGGEAIIGNEAIQTAMKARTLLRPQVNRQLCTGCGTCMDQCSVSALSRSNEGFPVVDADTCITCFCCQEVCPEKAITLS